MRVASLIRLRQAAQGRRAPHGGVPVGADQQAQQDARGVPNQAATSCAGAPRTAQRRPRGAGPAGAAGCALRP